MSAQVTDAVPAVPVSDELVEILSTKPTSLWRDAWFRLIRNNLAIAGGLFVILMVLVALLADLYPVPYDRQNLAYSNTPWGDEKFPLGTDYVGRDLVSRIIHGAR